MTSLPLPRLGLMQREHGIMILKWAASILQIMGYSATAFGLTPHNIYLFLIGLIGWLTVGILWRDKAIMLIHVVALGAMVVGLISG
ncbi:DUF6552 family protein [Sulfitobacter mediterraneus]|uniref:Ubiquinone biosynthesis methyltransferase UbiE n=1 Tax=Sulfitobacter mediterraneus TaxID=83219 RepID=A0A061SU82_9RHOB|nr:DUF6552 family protein [Sulfitobacter mediterraneus]KAJ04507.1 ubiquinone biosynthesis methyltransferase UbiE [Sulfitobacter mediterraneus]